MPIGEEEACEPVVDHGRGQQSALCWWLLYELTKALLTSRACSGEPKAVGEAAPPVG